MSTNRIKEPLLATLEELVSTDLKTFQWYLNQSVLDGFRHIPKSHLENADRTDTVDKMVDVYGPDRALKITLEILRKMNQNDSAERLMKNCQTGVTVTGGNRSTRSLPVEGKSPSFRSSVTTETGVQAAGSGGNSTKDEPCDESTAYKRRLQDQLRVMFHKISEGVKKQGKKTLLRNIYTELYVTETTSGDVNFEHEVRQIETASRKLARSEVPIAFNYIFKPSEGQDTIIRTVLTKGVAGIGKTVSVAKFILDWAEGKSNQDIQFIFPLMFRQINLLRQENYSLVDLLLECISEATSMSASDKTFLRRIFCHLQTSQTSNDHGREYKTLFVLDGLDECRPPLDSFNCRSCSDVTEPTSVAVLLTNLIKGKLLPSALLWITSRPAAANQIPSDYLDLVTEVRGFNDPQKEEYFMKKIKDEDQARRIFAHVKSSRTLYIMCHIPVFSWISATVLEKMDTEGGEMPKTLTQMYTQFVIVQVKQKNVKFREKTETEPHWDEENKQMISSLGKLAYEQLERGRLVFDEKDLEECGIDVKAAAVYSGVCTEMLAEDCGVWQRKAYCFVHLSIQEFLAALYVLLSFNNDNVDLMADQRPNEPKTHLNLKAIDRALQSESGYWDLMLRFLLGLSLESNQVRLQGLLRPTRNSSQSHKETVAYIQERIRMNSSPERCMNLFHCLNELNDHSLLDTLQSYLMSGNMARRHLLPEQWSALAFVLLTSDQELEVFDMKKYSRSEDGLQRLLPVVKASRTALLNHCHLSENCCDMLASALSSSKLRELDLSSNRLHDSGVKMISSGLGNPHCQLETLSLSDCLLTGKGCRYLTLSLTSNPTPLKVLDLSNNDLRNSGVKMLSDLLKDPRCVLESLR